MRRVSELLLALRSAFDVNGDGVINFVEYCAGLSVMLKGSQAEKFKVSPPTSEQEIRPIPSRSHDPRRDGEATENPLITCGDREISGRRAQQACHARTLTAPEEALVRLLAAVLPDLRRGQVGQDLKAGDGQCACAACGRAMMLTLWRGDGQMRVHAASDQAKMRGDMGGAA